MERGRLSAMCQQDVTAGPSTRDERLDYSATTGRGTVQSSAPPRLSDALLTNFHLPRSTLLMLVAAFAGYESTMTAYRTAVTERYRLYSYGDAMAIV